MKRMKVDLKDIMDEDEFYSKNHQVTEDDFYKKSNKNLNNKKSNKYILLIIHQIVLVHC